MIYFPPLLYFHVIIVMEKWPLSHLSFLKEMNQLKFLYDGHLIILYVSNLKINENLANFWCEIIDVVEIIE